MRPALKTALKISLLLPLGLLGLAVVLYLLLLIINRHDQPPSATYLTLMNARDQRPVPDSTDNAYIFFTGFGTSRGKDPIVEGQRFLSGNEATLKSGGEAFPSIDRDIRSELNSIPEPLKSTMETCSRDDDACIGRLFVNRRAMLPLLAGNAWMLERYTRMIRMPHWRESNSIDYMMDYPGYAEILDIQKLFLIKAWISAFNGNTADFRSAIDEDSRFWKMALSSADTLVTRMVAVAALRRNLQMGNMAIQALPESEVADALPENWMNPISPTAKDLEIVFGGEMAFIESYLKLSQKTPRILPYEGDDETPPLWFRLADRLAIPLYKIQATSNMKADSFLSIAQALPMDYRGYPAFVAMMRESQQPEPFFRKLHPYNPVGSWMLGGDKTLYTDYIVRIADLEGMRRLALLMAEMHAKGVRRVDLEAAMQASTIKDPYTGQAFMLESGADFAVFSGLEMSESRRKHLFFYRP